jgi:RNA polymerase sigma-70 factor (ECF subfamily)
MPAPEDDARAFVGSLYDSYGASLYRYALMLLTDPAAAEDVVQQVFAAVLRQKGEIRNDVHYLRRAVRNECYSVLRRRERLNEVSLEQPLIEPVIADASHDERLALERALRDLPPEQREVIHLHVFQGLTLQEVADLSNMSINTVAARYRYALTKLKTLLT